MRLKQFVVMLIVASISFVGCNNNVDEPTPNAEISLSEGEITETSISVTVASVNAAECAWLLLDEVNMSVNADYIILQGTAVEPNATHAITIDNLEPATEYKVVAAARNATSAEVSSLTLTTQAKPHVKDEIELNFDKATRNNDDAPEGVCYVTLSNSVDGYSLNLIFNNIEDELTEGEYSVAEEQVTIAYIAGDTEEIHKADEGTVKVSRADDNYTFDIEFSNYNIVAKGSYTGVVEGMIPEKITLFTKASSVHGGADHSITFTSDDERIVLTADIYTYNSSYGYLDSGEYTVINSGYSFTAGQIDYYYSSLSIDGVSEKLDSGSIIVTLNDDLTYDITIDITDATGRHTKGTYSGAIENMNFVRGYEFVAAALNKSDSNTSDGKYNLTFKTTGSESADYLTLTFYAEEGGNYLPAGTYNVSEERSGKCIDTDSINFITFSYGTPVIESGSVVVTINEDDTYSFVFDFKQAESHVSWQCSYSGGVANMDTTDSEGTTLHFVSANGYYSDDSSETYVYLVADNGKQLKLGLIDLEWQTHKVTPGTYTVSSAWAKGSIYSGWYGTDWNDGVGFASGSAIFSNDSQGTYTVEVNITLTNDENYNGVYIGSIEGL